MTRGFGRRPVAARLFREGLGLLRLVLRCQTRRFGERSIAFGGSLGGLRLQPFEFRELACGFFGARPIERRRLALLRALPLLGLERFLLLLK